jgi:hypothetical protein
MPLHTNHSLIRQLNGLDQMVVRTRDDAEAPTRHGDPLMMLAIDVDQACGPHPLTDP